VGLVGKNAILIVEFAKETWRRAQPDRAICRPCAPPAPDRDDLAGLRLGVLPLAISTGAGSGASTRSAPACSAA
jgi:HAE1 family hydrophobic/amphiphilic exporter-1/multidrug efflux pump